MPIFNNVNVRLCAGWGTYYQFRLSPVVSGELESNQQLKLLLYSLLPPSPNLHTIPVLHWIRKAMYLPVLTVDYLVGFLLFLIVPDIPNHVFILFASSTACNLVKPNVDNLSSIVSLNLPL